MHRTAIAVVDASRARLFTVERRSDGEGLHENLVEQQDFINPSRRLTPSEQLSDAPGSGQVGTQRFGLDDHRDAYVDKLDLEFARMVNRQIEAMLHTLPARRLVVCAGPRMLGHLRATRTRPSITIVEIPRDFVKLTPPELRHHLFERGLLPGRPLPERLQ